jgi:hypothetical protein
MGGDGSGWRKELFTRAILRETFENFKPNKNGACRISQELPFVKHKPTPKRRLNSTSPGDLVSRRQKAHNTSAGCDN